MGPVQELEDPCIVILPRAAVPPRPLLEALVKALDEGGNGAVLVLAQGEPEDSSAEQRESEVPISLDEIPPAVGVAAAVGLVKIGTKIVDKVIDGASVAIADSYRDNRAAMKFYDDRAAATLRANDRYFGRA